MTNIFLSLHSWAASRNGKAYRILCSVLRLVTVKIEGAPKEIVKMEWRILKEKMAI